MSDVTVQLGRWVAGLRAEALPPEVRDHLKLCLLDTIGCGLYGAAQPAGRITADVAASSTGRAMLLGRTQTANAADAALANGTAIHGFELDDVHLTSSFHPACVTVPSVLAMSASSGLDLLTALAVGYEVGIRIGICAGTTHSTSGYQVTGTVGPIAAAASAAKCLGLDDARAIHAIALGATQASGLYAARKGAMAKRFHAGRAAQSGVLAALLAERGLTGSADVLEADFGGFFSTLHGQFAPETVLEGLGQRWEIMRVGFKRFAACASAHTTVEAMLQLRAQGVTADSVAAITINMTKKGFTNIGWPYVPNGVVAAQMNGRYAAAVALLEGDAFVAQYTEQKLAAPEILKLIERIHIAHDPAMDVAGAAGRHAVNIEARLTDGRTIKLSLRDRIGSAERPLSRAEIETKFEKLTQGLLTLGKVAAIVRAVDGLDRAPDAGELIALLKSGSAAES